LLHSVLLGLGSHQVERRTSLEPLNLALVVRVSERDAVLASALVLGNKSDLRAGCHLSHTLEVDNIVRLDLLIVAGVLEGEGEETLLLCNIAKEMKLSALSSEGARSLAYTHSSWSRGYGQRTW